jgi:hypothetical protein
MLSAVLAASFCCCCWGMPEWPAEGVADADWVEQALEWRLSKGVDDCGQEMLALDALSLEWVANSTEIQVNIETQNWPFLAVSPELMAPLIQLHVWRMMRGKEIEKEEVNRAMKRIARRTKTVRFREIRSSFN